jgi:hypothetical protein
VITVTTETVLSITAALLAVAAGIHLVRWMGRTADLRLSLFRPYRGESWPQGVQEDDTVHWRWDVPQRPAGSVAAEDVDHDDDRPSDPGEPLRIVEGGHATVTRLGPVHVGRPGGH